MDSFISDKYARYKPRPGSAYATCSHQRRSKKQTCFGAYCYFVWVFWLLCLRGLFW